MDRYELIKTAASGNKVSYRLAENIILGAFEVISEQLRKGGNVTISGFGTFKVENRNTRIGRNPHTGEMITIPQRKIPIFKPHRRLKEEVNGR